MPGTVGDARKRNILDTTRSPVRDHTYHELAHATGVPSGSRVTIYMTPAEPRSGILTHYVMDAKTGAMLGIRINDDTIGDTFVTWHSIAMLRVEPS